MRAHCILLCNFQLKTTIIQLLFFCLSCSKNLLRPGADWVQEVLLLTKAAEEHLLPNWTNSLWGICHAARQAPNAPGGPCSLHMKRGRYWWGTKINCKLVTRRRPATFQATQVQLLVWTLATVTHLRGKAQLDSFGITDEEVCLFEIARLQELEEQALQRGVLNQSLNVLDVFLKFWSRFQRLARIATLVETLTTFKSRETQMRGLHFRSRRSLRAICSYQLTGKQCPHGWHGDKQIFTQKLSRANTEMLHGERFSREIFTLLIRHAILQFNSHTLSSITSTKSRCCVVAITSLIDKKYTNEGWAVHCSETHKF